MSQVGYKVGSYTGGATEHTGNAKCWYTGGFWWAVLQDDSGSDWGIYKKDSADPATGATGGWTHTTVYVDTRDTTLMDVYWNEGLAKLHLLRMHGSTPYYSEYDYSGGTYTKNATVGDTAATGLTDATNGCIVVDGTDQVFMFKIIVGTGLVVRYSTNANRTTFSDLTLDSNCNSTANARPAACVWGTTAKIGVLYQDTVNNKLRFAYHLDSDGDAIGNWTFEDVDASITCDNHTSVQALDDVVIAVIKNTANDISVYRRSGGSWSANTDIQPDANVSRPIAVIDETNSEVYVFYMDITTGVRGIAYKKSSITGALSFGSATKVIEDTTISANMWDVQSTHNLVNSTTGLMVIAQNTVATDNWWNKLTIAAAAAGDTQEWRGCYPPARRLSAAPSVTY